MFICQPDCLFLCLVGHARARATHASNKQFTVQPVDAMCLNCVSKQNQSATHCIVKIKWLASHFFSQSLSLYILFDVCAPFNMIPCVVHVREANIASGFSWWLLWRIAYHILLLRFTSTNICHPTVSISVAVTQHYIPESCITIHFKAKYEHRKKKQSVATVNINWSVFVQCFMGFLGIFCIKIATEICQRHSHNALFFVCVCLVASISCIFAEHFQ